MRLEIRDIHRHPGKRGTEDAPLAGEDFHAGPESHSGIDMFDHWPTCRVVDLRFRGLGRDDELAALAIAEGEVLQISLENQPAIVAPPGDDAALQPVTCLSIDH